jgi:AcrR family transcriptional regulator
MNKSRGRPRGHPPTKARIAAAARDLFLRHGYRGTTMRAIAAQAGVDQALLSYHFGSKHGLFSESMQLKCGQSLAVSQAFAGDPANLPERLLDALADLSSLEPTLTHDEEAMAVFREFLENELLGRIAEFIGGPRATEHAAAAVAVLGGLIFTRYLNPLRPLAEVDPSTIRRILGPPLRAALYEPAQSRPHPAGLPRQESARNHATPTSVG